MSFASLRLNPAVLGICALSTASCAAIVPGTAASTAPSAPAGSIIEKSGGSLSVANTQGPARACEENQRPDSSTK